MAEILTGARARFSLDGVKVGFATNVSVREIVTFEPVKVLDDIQVKEHVPTDYDVSLTADTIRIVGDTLKSRNWFAKQGGSPEDHLTNLLNTGELTASLEDSRTGKIVANVEGVKISERGINVSSRGIVGENVSFVAKRVRDESDLLG
jgi:hypothetical protein